MTNKMQGPKLKWRETDRSKNGDIVTAKAEADRIRLAVTRHIHFDPKEWVFRCEDIGIMQVIGNGTLYEAELAAESLLRAHLRAALNALSAP